MAWHGGLPGLASAQAGMAGRTRPQREGYGGALTYGPFSAWERGEQPVGALVPPAVEEHEQAGGRA
jgi:hypothetical protein